MMTILLAAAAAASTPALSADRDVHCMAALLVAAGSTKDDDPDAVRKKAGLASLVMYFYGKLDARRPGADLKGEVMTLIASPNYQAMLRPDFERCSGEVEARGKYLQSFMGPGAASTP